MTKINRIAAESRRAETLKECKRIVWAYRKELEHVWPCPDIWDSLLFCQTELGEAIDAYLRSKPEYARNRDKDLDVLDELGDLALMAFTALGAEHEEVCGWWKPYDDVQEGGTPEQRFAWYAAWLGDALHEAVYFYDDVNKWRRSIAHLLNSIATHPGMDLPARLTARLERIKAKRLEVTHG